MYGMQIKCWRRVGAGGGEGHQKIRQKNVTTHAPKNIPVGVVGVMDVLELAVVEAGVLGVVVVRGMVLVAAVVMTGIGVVDGGIVLVVLAIAVVSAGIPVVVGVGGAGVVVRR